jgi:hypothetical protein
MDWGFGNPNKTAALICLLMLGVWAFAYIRKWGFWAALLLFTGFGVCLILTQSRGGLIGTIVGGSALLWSVRRPFPLHRVLAVLAACLALVVFACVIKAENRLTQGIWTKDLSLENRWLIWSQVPTMIHDAPGGWGLGKSGDAYMQWYQPVNRGEGYRTLVNSHLTWLTELGWGGRAAYIAFWLGILVLLYPLPVRPWLEIPFSIWIAWALCACFSSVAEAPLLWVIPLGALATVVLVRWKEKTWPSPKHWIVGAVALIFIICAIFFWGLLLAKPSSVYSPRMGEVILGSKTPTVWLIAPNRNILGEHFGHEIRRGLTAEPIFQKKGLGVVSTLAGVPQHQTLIFSCQIPQTLGEAVPSQVVLIDPSPALPETVRSLSNIPRVTIIVGEFSQNKRFWEEQAHSHSNLKLQVVEGSEEFIPDWMHEIAKALSE